MLWIGASNAWNEHCKQSARHHSGRPHTPCLTASLSKLTNCKWPSVWHAHVSTKDRNATTRRRNTLFDFQLHRGFAPPGNAMLCCSSHQVWDEDYCDPCLLVPSTAGFVQTPSRGRLYYLPNGGDSIENTPNGYFRNRVARPSLLRIASVAADRRISRSLVSFDHKPFRFVGKLARSREQAKRFLRFSFSQNPTPPVQPVPFEPVTEGSLAGVEAGDMVFADAGRRSPTRRERGSSIVGGPISGMVHRPRLADDVHRASASSATAEPTISITSLASEKPIVSGNGVSISISLAEPVLYLQGFDQNDTSSRSTTMLRGSMLLRVTKQAKVKTISLNFRGRSETDWPEGRAALRFLQLVRLITCRHPS